MKYYDKKNLDTAVVPGDDFFHYSIGGWIKKNPIPEEKSRWSSFDVLHAANQKKLKTITTALKKKKDLASHEILARDFYFSGMHKNREKLGIAPLAELLHDVASVETEEEFLSQLAFVHALGVSALWSPFVESDEKKSEVQILYLYQGGLTLPDKEYYLSAKVPQRKIRSAYKKHFTRMGKYFEGVSNGVFVRDVISVENYLAKNARTKTELRDVHRQYNKMNLTSLKKAAPKVDWQLYFDEVGADPKASFIVGQPEYFSAVSEAMEKFSLMQRKRYLLWRLFVSFTPFLSEDIYEDHFAFFLKELMDVATPQPQWKRVISSTDSHIGEALGRVFAETYFTAASRKSAQDLAATIKRTFAKRVKALEWMEEKTKEKALFKLKKMTIKIGHPTKFETYKDLVIVGDDYFGNVCRARTWEHMRQMRRIGKKTNRALWEMTAPTVNAYYHPLNNEMVFPAGILQPPFYDALADDALNYGGIGAVIAHEITHGFDDNGSLFDENGNIKNWWTKKDKKAFDVLTKKMIALYDGFEVLSGLKAQGGLTVGENMADFGGIMIGLEAYKVAAKKKDVDIYKKGPDGFSGVQRFFLSCGLMEAGSCREAERRRLNMVDPHAAAILRVNGPLPHITDFYEAFDVVEGQALYRKPKDRIVIW